MPNLNNIIFAGHEYLSAINIPGVGTFQLKTISEISYDHAAENELVYAVGNQFPIGNKQNAYKFSGKLSIQNGEMLQILKNAGVPSAIMLPNVTLSVATTDGSLQVTHSGMCINTANISIKAKDKETLISCDWTAILIS